MVNITDIVTNHDLKLTTGFNHGDHTIQRLDFIFGYFCTILQCKTQTSGTVPDLIDVLFATNQI